MLKHRNRALHLESLCEIEVLKTHTAHCSPPQLLIQSLSCRNDEQMRDIRRAVYSQLKYRFGSDVEIASSILHGLYKFPEARGSGIGIYTARHLRSFCDLRKSACS